MHHTTLDKIANAAGVPEHEVRDVIHWLAEEGYVALIKDDTQCLLDPGCGCDYAGQIGTSPVQLARAGQEGVSSEVDETTGTPLYVSREENRIERSRIEALDDELIHLPVDGDDGKIESQRRVLLRLFIALSMDYRQLYEWPAANKTIRGELSPHIRRWLQSGVSPRRIGDMMREFWSDVETGRVKIRTQPQRAFVAYRGEYSTTTTEAEEIPLWKSEK